ncbi:MAG TPA: DUF1761 domain-containing protein [Candidatus Paceibacterota bacterium]|jgi:hypothetical protein|nr:DUF1761 domain-containing protein [Candidatus Paceibacterota bacterium]
MQSIVSVWAVIVAAAVAIVLGFLWYGPLFGKKWMALMGISKPEAMTPEVKKQMMKSYFFLTISSLVAAGVLGHFFAYGAAFTGKAGFAAALCIGFWVWIGFAGPITLGSVLWERKPWKLWILNNAYYLISFILQSIVFSMWK